MDATVGAAADTGAGSIWLGVNQYNARANRFYQKQGFALVGVRRFLVGRRWHDDFVRERPLGGGELAPDASGQVIEEQRLRS